MKKHTVKGTVLQIKEPTLDESEKLEKLLGAFEADGNEIKGSLSQSELKEVLSLVLEREDGRELTPDLIGSIKPSRAVKIIKDFFLTQIISGLNMKQSLDDYRSEIKELLTSSND